jgi:hypothetical protein
MYVTESNEKVQNWLKIRESQLFDLNSITPTLVILSTSFFLPRFALFANWGTEGAMRNESAFSKSFLIAQNPVILSEAKDPGMCRVGQVVYAISRTEQHTFRDSSAWLIDEESFLNWIKMN